MSRTDVDTGVAGRQPKAPGPAAKPCPAPPPPQP
jgi:hypothetical protein